MLKNYWVVALRNLLRNKAFSAINILGLALGMACSLLILLWVQNERGVDAFHRNGQRLYQVYERDYYDGKISAGYTSQGLLADELKRNVPEIEYAAGMDYAAQPGLGNSFAAGDKINKMTGSFVGADFFRMFSFPLLQGRPATALNAPNTIAVSRRMAGYFFGSAEAAIGKIIRMDDKTDLQITAVFENTPANSSLQFDFLCSWIDYVRANAWVNNWGNTGPASFIQLRADADPGRVEARIKDFIYRYKARNPNAHTELAIQPYPEKYLHSTFKEGRLDGGRIEYVRMFTLVAIFVLLIACINFMNLATAQSYKRAKEIGLRKVIGAGRLSLIGQFIGEAILLAFLSLVVALTVTSLLLPAFNSLTGRELAIPTTKPLFWAAMIGLFTVTGFVAGSYPALFLSSLNPVRVLKGSLKFSWSATFFRKGLVVFQFTLSILLIVGMIVIYRQMDFIRNKNIGYDRENLVYIPIEGDLITKYQLFKEEAGAMTSVAGISKMRNSPTVIEHHTGNIDWPGKKAAFMTPFADGVVGYDFVKTMKLQLKEGRDFSREFGADSTGYLLNETAVKIIGLQNPIGKTVSWSNRPGKVIGVLKDFHFSSMHQTIDPLIVRLDENWSWGTILVRTRAGGTKEALDGLEKICRNLNPKFPFTWQFSDEEFTKLYKSETVVSQLSNYFAFLAIFISCLGLFGLATFTAAQRTKEIGIRKILGAGGGSLFQLLSRDFLVLVGIAFGMAVPLGWWAMQQWLQQFAYRTAITWWIFGLSGMLALGIALLTVSLQAIRTIRANPVKSLRAE